jgi:NitT/TauT family transport system substrate-binding protein
LNTGTLGAAFILAPLAMSLKQRGVPIRIVYLGHRDGTAMMVGADSGITSFRQLRGKKILVPSHYANQYVWLARLLSEHGMTLDDVEVRDCPPPDMPSMLETGGCDAYIVGEPFAARAEMAGTGKVLFLTKDSWPDFISCVVVVREELIQHERQLVQELVNGIAGSGMWLDEDMEHRLEAAEVAATHYYNQDAELLRFVLQKPPDRVKYTRLTPHKEDFDEIMELSVELGILEQPIAFEDYTDPSFAERFDGESRPMPPDNARRGDVEDAGAGEEQPR